MKTVAWEITSCDAPPDRTEFTLLLRAYYDLINERLATAGYDVSEGSQLAIAEFWDGIDAYLPPKGQLCLARDARGRLCGMGMLKTLRPGVGEMKRLFVLPHMRGTGLGRALVEVRVADARRRGLSTLLIDTLKQNVEMQGLYRSMGFRQVAHWEGGTTASLVPEIADQMLYFEMDLT